MRLYFARKAVSVLLDGSSGRYGFESNEPVTIYVSGTAGRIISPGAEVVFYGPFTPGGIRLNGEAPDILDSGLGWVKVYVKAGTFDIEFARD